MSRFNRHLRLYSAKLSRQGDTAEHFGLRNDEVTFWQSRMTVAGKPAERPQLVDLRALARRIYEETRHVAA